MMEIGVVGLVGLYVLAISPLSFPKWLLPKVESTTPGWGKVYQRVLMVVNECREVIVFVCVCTGLRQNKE
jgi:hypothetical protein